MEKAGSLTRFRRAGVAETSLPHLLGDFRKRPVLLRRKLLELTEDRVIDG